MSSVDITVHSEGRSGREFGHGFAVAGVWLIADAAGAAYLPDAGALVVADLHLEKGSAYAARGQLLPPYDTAATLARLAAAIMRHRPKTVVALGDSFHDAAAGERLGAKDRQALSDLMAGREWLWIAGNHDPEIPAGLGDIQAEANMAGLTFRHEPWQKPAPGEVAGHLHPAARVVSPSGSVRRRCFVTDGTRCILPAFGAYAGGLNFRSAAFAGLFGTAPVIAHVVHRERVYAIPEERCVAD